MKQKCAQKAFEMIQDKMTVGLGGGSTVALLIREIAGSRKQIRAVTPSQDTMELCMEYGVPTYCSSATTVASGCLATIAIDDVGIGEKTAEMALRYINGTPLADIPAEVVSADYVSVNAAMLEALGLTVDGETLEVGGVSYAVQVLGE